RASRHNIPITKILCTSQWHLLGQLRRNNSSSAAPLLQNQVVGKAVAPADWILGPLKTNVPLARGLSVPWLGLTNTGRYPIGTTQVQPQSIAHRLHQSLWK